MRHHVPYLSHTIDIDFVLYGFSVVHHENCHIISIVNGLIAEVLLFAIFVLRLRYTLRYCKPVCIIFMI